VGKADGQQQDGGQGQVLLALQVAAPIDKQHEQHVDATYVLEELLHVNAILDVTGLLLILNGLQLLRHGRLECGIQCQSIEKIATCLRRIPGAGMSLSPPEQGLHIARIQGEHLVAVLDHGIVVASYQPIKVKVIWLKT